MPYIKQERREDIEFAQNPGELNYLITVQCLYYLSLKGKSYATINDIVGALESAKLEFYRRISGPYEDMKLEENGDVY